MSSMFRCDGQVPYPVEVEVGGATVFVLPIDGSTNDNRGGKKCLCKDFANDKSSPCLFSNEKKY